jgi:hypothetical protein
VDCVGDAINYFKAIASSNFGDEVKKLSNEVNDDFRKHLLTNRTTRAKFCQKMFSNYLTKLGFKCHFQGMAKLLANSNCKPHTVVILQCPKADQYGMAKGTLTGEGLFTFMKPIQQACQDLEQSTVLCIEACSYCPALVGKGKIRSSFDL